MGTERFQILRTKFPGGLQKGERSTYKSLKDCTTCYDLARGMAQIVKETNATRDSSLGHRQDHIARISPKKRMFDDRNL